MPLILYFGYHAVIFVFEQWPCCDVDGLYSR